MLNTKQTPRSYQFYKDVETLARAHWDVLCNMYPGKHTGTINQRRMWWFREYQRYQSRPVQVRTISRYDGTVYAQTVYTLIHPAVYEAMDCFGPANGGHCLLLELPHQSTESDDPLRIAYTPNDKYGDADRQVATTVGKYIKRHWPNVPDHAIRDLVARFASPEMELWNTKEQIISAIEFGPRSCMKSTYGSIPFREHDRNTLIKWLENNDNPEPDWYSHPYATYAPELGWGMAVMVRRNGTKVPEVTDRCLIWTDPSDSDTKVFVRSYKRGESEESSSYSSEALESKLKDMGFKKRSKWPEGAELLRLDHPRRSGPLLPYLDGCDGDARWVEDTGHKIVKIDYEEDADRDSTTYMCDCTDGTGTEGENSRYTWTCPSCGEQMTDDDHEDSLPIGRYSDESVCHYCSDDYVEVRGSIRNGYRRDRERGYAEYFIASGDAQDVRGCNYQIDPDNPPDCVVELHSGEWAELDETVCIDGDYYMHNDRRIVELAEESPDGDMYALKSDAWEDGNGDWHHDDHEYIMYDGEKWMKDEAWQCEATGWWYPDHVDPTIDPMTGDNVHPDYLGQCNRDADFVIVYSGDTCSALPHIIVRQGETLISDRLTDCVYA